MSSGLLFVVVYICCALIKGVVEAGFADDGTEILTGLGSCTAITNKLENRFALQLAL